ncbi:hypothetical protein FRC08_006837 [Ceratobasidium sp. 394]|nr:hypothetical protein FRC08_006837 [Ceratobasidium sp. 394]
MIPEEISAMDIQNKVDKGEVAFAYFPSFVPPLRPVSTSWYSSHFQHLIFVSKPTTSYASPFDLPGETPLRYATHAKLLPYEQPPIDPQYVVHAANQAERLPGSDLRVYFLDSNTIVKIGMEELQAEAISLHMIHTMTSIPVPAIKQVVIDSTTTYLVMEYIKGPTLERRWSDLGFFAKLRVVWTLRGYVSQLRRLQRSVPGPINGGECQGYLFPIIGAGPFASYDDFTAWYNHKLEVCQRMGQAPPNAPRFDNSWPLVFTHGDISPRNVIISGDGTVFLIDWGCSGFFPVWHEYVCMRSDCGSHELPSGWQYAVPWIAGWYYRMLAQISMVSWAIVVGYLM